MKKIYLLGYLLIYASSFLAQTEYQKGYFINNDNQRTECFILNEDWYENPFSFTYKLNPNGEELHADIEDITCFEIDSILKYVRREVEVDLSADIGIENYSLQQAPEFETQILFLNVLVEGDLNLYYYKGDNLTRFFIKYMDEKTTQLIFKWHYTVDGGLAKNELYKRQLASYMQCNPQFRFQIMDVSYVKKSLVKLFESYEKCSGKPNIYYQAKRKGHFVLNASAGGSLSFLEVITTTGVGNYKQSGIYGFNMGPELEYFFPIKNNKLTLIIKPSIEIDRSGFHVSDRHYAKYKLNYLTLPIGLRYYGYMQNNRRLFFNAGVSFSSAISSGIDTYNKNIDNEPTTHAHFLPFTKFTLGFFAGVGYGIDKLAFELRYNGINQNLTNLNPSWKVRQNNLSIVAFYSFDFVKQSSEIQPVF